MKTLHTIALSSIVLFVVITAFTVDSMLYQKVVTMPAFSLSQLSQYSLQYFKNEEYTTVDEPAFSSNPDSTTFQYQQQFMVYNRSMLKHPVGLLTYRATIDLKDEKIRFSSDSVYFLNYVRNRYSRYVPESKPAVPLAEWKDTWRDKEREKFEAQIEASLEEDLQEFVHYLQAQKETKVNTTQLEQW